MIIKLNCNSNKSTYNMQYYNKQMCGYVLYMVKIRLLRIYQLKNKSINIKR